MFLPWVFASVLALPQILVVVAEEATCIVGTLHWTFNSANESPCEVASSLLGVCEGSSYTVQALPEGTHYIGPILDQANDCQCSSVTYSLLSACAECQNRTISSWSEWSANCVDVSNEKFEKPLPSGVLVPGWAYLDVETLDSFDIAAAEGNSKNLTESTAVPVPTQASATRTIISSRISPTSSSGVGALSDNSAMTTITGNVLDSVTGAVIIGLAFAALLI